MARVLITDNDPDAADAEALMLRLRGHQVKVAYDGHGALETIRVFRPHVVVFDIGMPGIDGYTVAKQVREKSPMRSVLIALTDAVQLRARAMEAGFDHYLIKPVEPELLRSIIAQAPTSMK